MKGVFSVQHKNIKGAIYYLSLRMVIGIPSLGMFLLLESGFWKFFLKKFFKKPKSEILGFGIQNLAQSIGI